MNTQTIDISLESQKRCSQAEEVILCIIVSILVWFRITIKNIFFSSFRIFFN